MSLQIDDYNPTTHLKNFLRNKEGQHPHKFHFCILFCLSHLYSHNNGQYFLHLIIYII